MKKRVIFGISVLVLGTTVGVLAQVHHVNPGFDLWAQTSPLRVRPSKNMALTKNEAPLTPAQKARLMEVGRLDTAATAAMNAGNYAEAEADARDSMAAGTDSGVAQETLASALYAQGKVQEAFQAYKTIADEGGDFPRNLLPYALLSLKAGHWIQAVDAYNKALPHLGFGDLMRKNGYFSPTVSQPTELEAAIEVGMGLTGEGADFRGTYQQRSELAQTYFQKALALEPDAPLANYYYGYGLQRMNQRQEAQAAFKKAAALDVDNGDVKAAAENALAGR